MSNHHRVVWEMRIEVGSAKLVVSRQGVVIVTVGHNGLARLDMLLLLKLLQRANDAFYRVPRAEGRRINIGLSRHAQRVDEMAVPVNESWQ